MLPKLVLTPFFISIIFGHVSVSFAEQFSGTEKAAHTLSRLSYGARPGEIESLAKAGPKGFNHWLENQLYPERLDDQALDSKLSQFPSVHMDSLELLRNYQDLKELVQSEGMDFSKVKEDSDEKKALQKQYHDRLPARILEDLQGQRLVRAVESKRQLQEMLFDFWWNHFNVDWSKGPIRWLATSYEREAIRKHIFGNFGDLLRATAHHPAMLVYLDNNSSRVAGPKGNQGLNENYAREIMELHTLGVDGGYTQKDVTELARILTGWTVESVKEDPAFVFKPKWHDMNAKNFLGQNFPAGQGLDEGERALTMLAESRATARFISTKLAKYFVSDTPPPHLIDVLTAQFLATHGDLRKLYRTLFTRPEFWSRESVGQKIKRPFQYVVSAIRSLGGEVDVQNNLVKILAEMGEEPYKCAPPTGYKDEAAVWINPGALLARMEFAMRFAAQKVDGVFCILPKDVKATENLQLFVDSIAVKVLGHKLSPKNSGVVMQQLSSESRTFADNEVRPIALAKATALILGSPEFQRR